MSKPIHPPFGFSSYKSSFLPPTVVFWGFIFQTMSDAFWKAGLINLTVKLMKQISPS